MAWRRSNPAAGPWALGDWRIDASIAAGIALAGATIGLNGLVMAGERPLEPAVLAGWAMRSLATFAVCLVLARTISCGHRLWLADRSPRWPHLLALWPVALLPAAWLGTALALLRADRSLLEWRPWHPWIGGFVTHWLLVAAMLLLLHEAAWWHRRRAAQLHEAEVARLTQRRELDAARAQLLRAHVEPHFLFNALANVSQLLKTDAEAARRLLHDLMRYLQEALPGLRGDESTLAQEGELVRAYLAVFQVRMGSRLRAEIDLPRELHDCAVPPLTMLTLVENAIRHGLQPLVEGGSLAISARAEGASLRLVVADTGRGMAGAIGYGSGLTNLRARLHAAFGDNADLSLRVNEPRGVVATVTLPLTRT